MDFATAKDVAWGFCNYQAEDGMTNGLSFDTDAKKALDVTHDGQIHVDELALGLRTNKVVIVRSHETIPGTGGFEEDVFRVKLATGRYRVPANLKLVEDDTAVDLASGRKGLGELDSTLARDRAQAASNVESQIGPMRDAIDQAEARAGHIRSMDTKMDHYWLALNAKVAYERGLANAIGAASGYVGWSDPQAPSGTPLYSAQTVGTEARKQAERIQQEANQ